MFKDTFDTTNALTNMIMWLAFGFLSSMINCDIQNFLKSNLLIAHLIALSVFFFLFTLEDDSNMANMGVIFVKTIIVYLVFVIMTKSKWYFVLPVVFLLGLNQFMKKKLEIQNKRGKNDENEKKSQQLLARIITPAIVILSVIGLIHYYFLQKLQHQDDFSWFKFIFEFGRCRN